MAKQAAAAGPVEGLWALPDGWRWERLGDVCEPSQYGWTTKAASSGDLRFLRTTDISSGRVDWKTVPFCTEKPSDVDRYRVRAGDILISRAGSVGKSFLIESADDAVFASYLIRYRPLTVPRYVYHWLQTNTYWSMITESTAGIAIPNVNASKLSDLPVPMAPDQLREPIVDRIDELFAEIDNGEVALVRARADLATWRKALLNAAVTGELTADWRTANPPAETGADLLDRLLSERRAQWAAAPRNKGKKYKEPAQPDLELFGIPPELPTGWTWASAAQLTTLVTSGSRGWADYYSEAGATFIRAQNINTDTLRLAGIAYVTPPKGGEGSRTRVSKGDILITITGANVTKSAIVDIDLEEAYVSQHVGLMRPTDIATAEFLFWWIVTPGGGRKILERLAYGAGKPGLNLPNLLGLPVPLPPLDEQREIARLCASVDDERAACVNVTIEGQQAASTLRQSILAAAFRGDLA